MIIDIYIYLTNAYIICDYSSILKGCFVWEDYWMDFLVDQTENYYRDLQG